MLALDGEPRTRDRVLAITQGTAQERLTIETIHFPDLIALPVADLVYAGYSLPYIHPDDFARVWDLIRSSLRPGVSRGPALRVRRQLLRRERLVGRQRG